MFCLPFYQLLPIITKEISNTGCRINAAASVIFILKITNWGFQLNTTLEYGLHLLLKLINMLVQLMSLKNLVRFYIIIPFLISCSCHLAYWCFICYVCFCIVSFGFVMSKWIVLMSITIWKIMQSFYYTLNVVHYWVLINFYFMYNYWFLSLFLFLGATVNYIIYFSLICSKKKNVSLISKEGRIVYSCLLFFVSFKYYGIFPIKAL